MNMHLEDSRSMPLELGTLAAELARCELTLDGYRALRLAGVVAAPLGVALCTQTGWLVGLCWALSLWLFFPLLRGWGYSYLALLVAVLPWYALFALGRPPLWAAAVGLAVTLSMLLYMSSRLKNIRRLRVALQARPGETKPGQSYVRIRRQVG
jgi:hypothetical protein